MRFSPKTNGQGFLSFHRYYSLLAILAGVGVLHAADFPVPGDPPKSGSAGLMEALPVEASPGVGLPIRYELAKLGKVSLNIYDEEGQVVRELLRVTQRGAGAHLEIWDGLDRFGKPLPPAKYSWKLVSTPGFKAEFLLKVGTNYPIKPNAEWWQQAPGDITGPGSVFADESGLYVGSATENIGPCLIKQTLDGSKRLWERKLPSAYVIPRGMARIGNVLWVFSANDKYLLPLNAETGADAGKPISTLWEKSSGHLMAGVGDFLAVSYPEKNAVRLLDPKTGEVVVTLEIPKASGLAGWKNLLYVTDGKAIWKVNVDPSSDKIEAIPFAQDLTGVSLLAVDPTTGEVLAYEGNQFGVGNNQIKRLSPSGKLVKSHGRPGGRKHGLYTTEEQESFAGVFGLATLPDGRFAIAEPWMPPRRTAVFNPDGKLQQEWYGSQMWAPFIFPEPDNPNAVWMASDWNGYMRLLVDYDKRTWKVHSTYRWDAVPLGPQSSDIGSGMSGFVREGKLYLQPEGRADFLELDRENWKVKQVVAQEPLLQMRYGQKRHELSKLVQEWVAPHSLKGLWLDNIWWIDANRDGQAQREEVQWRRNTSPKVWVDANGDGQLQPEEESDHGFPRVGWAFLDNQLSIYWLDEQFRFYKLPITGWSETGVPSFGSVIAPPPVSAPEWLHAVKGPNFPTVDSKTGDVYVAANQFKAWGDSSASYMVRIGADGKFKWAVGGAGSDPGQIRYFRRNLGVVKGCVAATNTSNEWPSEYLPRTYVWDPDGLYLGGLLDNPQLKPGEPLWHFAAGAEAKNGVVWENPKTGEVFYFGHWTSDGRIYKITGWDGWERFAGTVELKQVPGTGGNGLTASLLDADGKTVEQWLSPKVSFDAAKDLGSKPAQSLVKTGKFGVRFFGRVEPPEDGDYQFTVKASGRTRVLVDGRIVFDSGLPADQQKLIQQTLPLKAKQRRWLQVEYWPKPGEPARMELGWNRPIDVKETVPGLMLFATPNPDALPFGEGTGLTATYFSGVIPLDTLVDPTVGLGNPSKSQVEPEINTDLREFSIIWEGEYQPRNTGWTRLRGSSGFVMRLKLQDRVAPEHYLYLEAGKKYPIVAYARAWSDIHNTKFSFNLQTSRWTAPNTTEENMVRVPQSQLFPKPNAP